MLGRKFYFLQKQEGFIIFEKKIMKTQKKYRIYCVFQPVCSNYWYNNWHRQRGLAMGKHMYSFIFAPYCVFCKNNRNKYKDKDEN